jgi:hypothetical protein
VITPKHVGDVLMWILILLLKQFSCASAGNKTLIDSSNSPQIFHQNIRGLWSKTDELINYLEIYNINPHVLCFSEHHMEEQDLLHLTLPGYILEASVCYQNLQKDGVSILVHKTCISAKSILHITAQKRIWKSVPMN